MIRCGLELSGYLLRGKKITTCNHFNPLPRVQHRFFHFISFFIHFSSSVLLVSASVLD